MCGRPRCGIAGWSLLSRRAAGDHISGSRTRPPALKDIPAATRYPHSRGLGGLMTAQHMAVGALRFGHCFSRATSPRGDDGGRTTHRELDEDTRRSGQGTHVDPSSLSHQFFQSHRSVRNVTGPAVDTRPCCRECGYTLGDRHTRF